ncbi:proteasome regulatory particle base subunit [Coemansia sp. RSA 2599]|nr:proteasome regulatory particle base subunit [Coemansia sp. RSA 2599]
MTRVLPYQEKYMKWSSGSRYVPVKSGKVSGVVLVKDTAPGEPEDFLANSIEDDAKESEEPKKEEATVPPPEPFEYPFGSQQA